MRYTLATRAYTVVKAAVRRVMDALSESGIEVEPREFAEGTRTAEDAAAALGVEVGQIVKSLVFTAGGEPLLVLVSGANRASVPKLEAALGTPVGRADAATVRGATGYAIGGVPPIGHFQRLRTLVDAALLGYPVVWAAAGTPNSVFPVEPDALVRTTGGVVLDVAE